jgi:hypothetical protein
MNDPDNQSENHVGEKPKIIHTLYVLVVDTLTKDGECQ